VRFTSIPSYANDSSYDCSRIPITIQSHAIPCHDTSKRNEAYHIFSFPLYFPLLFLAWAGVKVLHTHTHTHRERFPTHACMHTFIHSRASSSLLHPLIGLSLPLQIQITRGMQQCGEDSSRSSFSTRDSSSEQQPASSLSDDDIHGRP
jgi:hypothetical protein